MSRLNFNAEADEVIDAKNEAIDGELDKLILSHVDLKEQIDSLTGKLNDVKQKIIEELNKIDGRKYKGPYGSASMVVKESVSLDEVGMIGKLKELNILDPIKTKEYIDNAALEDAIRRGELKNQDTYQFFSSKPSEYPLIRGKK